MLPRVLFFLLALVALTGGAIAQITLTQNDAPPFGTMITTYMTDALVTVNHGSAGANQTWTFGAFAWGTPSHGTVISPAGTPYASSFPTATHCFFNPDSGTSYSYLHAAANGFFALGSGSPDTVAIFNPEWLQIVLPCTYNTAWSSVRRTTSQIGPYTMTMTDSTRFTIDAWGHITTPYYNNVPCLRAFWHNYIIVSIGPIPPTTSESIGYTWFANGALDVLHISADNDVTDPNFTSGIVEMTARNEAVNPVRGPIAEHFAVEQNYPNPFNPTTTLPVELTKNTQVTLDIYDETGRRVMTRQMELPAGHHDLSIDGSRWANGTYFAQVRAADLAKTVKMQLVK